MLTVCERTTGVAMDSHVEGGTLGRLLMWVNSATANAAAPRFDGPHGASAARGQEAIFIYRTKPHVLLFSAGLLAKRAVAPPGEVRQNPRVAVSGARGGTD